jgi:hypothetical protein
VKEQVKNKWQNVQQVARTVESEMTGCEERKKRNDRYDEDVK